MRKSEIERHCHYAIRHFGDSADDLTVVKVLGPNPRGGYNCLKLSTGRMIHVKSAAKFRYKVTLGRQEK